MMWLHMCTIRPPMTSGEGSSNAWQLEALLQMQPLSRRYCALGILQDPHQLMASDILPVPARACVPDSWAFTRPLARLQELVHSLPVSM